MAGTLLETKISLPILRQSLVPREKVLGKLNDGFRDGHTLTLFSAPAGYGKTTSVRMWVREAGLNAAWVTLEKEDNNIKQFLEYVLTALGKTVPDLGQATLEVVENAQEIDLQRILGLLINDMHELDQPLMLVLEDYHVIENPAIDQFMEQLISHTVSKLHLVITTREDPAFGLARFRARNLLTEIRAKDLSFSQDEVNDFFSIVMGVTLTGKEMETLKNRTEGWVAGLQLAALSLKEAKDTKKFVESFKGTHRHILDYLIEEVLKSQPDDVQAFLRRTSILDQLSPSLCEAVTGQKGGKEYLQYLENSNLFLVALDEERKWYRYHALFSELLHNQLAQIEPQRIDDLQESAAGWYEKNGFIQKAVEHAFQIQKGAMAARLIETHAVPMLYQGEVSTVAGWFKRISLPLIPDSPMMWINKAWSLALQQRETLDGQVREALQGAEAAAKMPGISEDLRKLVAGHAASIEAFIMQSPALAGQQPDRLIELSQKAQQLLPEDEKGIRAVNSLNIGYGYTALGDLTAAETAFKETFKDGMAGGNLYAGIYGPINLIIIATMRGQLKEALELCDANIVQFNRILAGRNFPPIGALYILKGCVLLEENSLEEAEETLNLGLSLIRWSGEYETHILGYAALARLYATQGNFIRMQQSIKSLEETRPETSMYAKALFHRLSIFGPLKKQDNLEEAYAWANQVRLNFSSLDEYKGFDKIIETYFRAYLCAAHILTRMRIQHPYGPPLTEAHAYFIRQEKFAENHGLTGRLIEIWIIRALMYYAEGKIEDARHAIRPALEASAKLGYFRIFLDEADLIKPLLESVGPLYKDKTISSFIDRLMTSVTPESTKPPAEQGSESVLRDRELEVLRLLAAGQSYKEIGQNLYLSLNTVQFHVKNIYSKLSVNRRVQAIEKAREMNLILM